MSGRQLGASAKFLDEASAYNMVEPAMACVMRHDLTALRREVFLRPDC